MLDKKRILSGENMWISKNEYNKLKWRAEDNEHDAEMFRKLIRDIREKKSIIHSDFIIVSFDVWNELSNKWQFGEDKVKDIQAELEWYKVKYHEMKTNKDAINTRSTFEHCMDCGNYGWDMPHCRECSAENNYKYFARKYNDNE